MNEELKWYQYEKKEKEFLDNINLMPYLKINTKLLDIIKQIRTDYYQKFPIFTYLDEYDFYEYLIKRYPKININIQEQKNIYIITKI